jgi:tight adherence protein C
VTWAAAAAFLAGALAVAGAGLVAEAAAGRHGRVRHAAETRVLRLLAGAGRRLRPRGFVAPGELAARIAAAGSPAGLGPRELMAAKTFAALAGAGVAALSAGAAPGRLGLALAAGGPVGCFLAPDLWLLRRAAQRARRIRAELPALIELLRVSTEAGRSLPAALGDVGARMHGPLAAEWRAVAREVSLGVPVDTALAGMAERAPLAEVRALVAALDRARRHGAPLADTLAAQVHDARFALARAAREEAARAGPKIQLIVALLLVPSVLLLVAAALVAALMGGPESGAGGGLVLPL